MQTLYAPKSNWVQLVTSLGILALALVYFTAFGYFGLFRGGDFGFDFEVFYTAGEHMVAGEDPWLAAIGGPAFSYPPNISFILLVLGALPFDLALALQSLASVAAIGAIVVLANMTFLKVGSVSDLTIARSLCLAALIANPFAAHIFFMGQFSLITTALALWAWHLSRGYSDILAGVLLGLASIKPQICFLLVVWFLLEGKFRIVFVSGLVAVTMSLPAFLSFGIVGTMTSWFASMQYYLTVPFNQPGFQHVVGLNSLFASLGVTEFGAVFRLLGLAMFASLFLFRRHFTETTVLFLIFSISLTFFYGHDYDYIMIVPMLSYLLWCSLSQARMPLAFVGVGLLFLFWVPQRFLRDFEFDVVQHWRTIALLSACALLVYWEVRGAKHKGLVAVS